VKKLRITIGEKVYEVTVEILDEGQSRPPGPLLSSVTPLASTPVHAVHTAAPLPIPAGPGDLISPLSGKLVAMDTKVGAEVKEGDQLVTVEAMKMNTYIYAPKTGKVLEVLVAVGDAVREGQVLVRIE
jgi:biotin carboxyl carrier protein